jgi:hypothetical protein
MVRKNSVLMSRDIAWRYVDPASIDVIALPAKKNEQPAAAAPFCGFGY